MSKIQTSLHGRKAGLDADGKVIAKGFRAGFDGSQIDYPSPSTVAYFDDFLGDVIADQWAVVEGAAGNTDPAVLAGGINGLLRLTTGATGTLATDLTGITAGILQWQASEGGLAIEARVKLSAITNVYLFVGFTDLATVEAPIISAASANTLTTNASDAVGVMFDTGMTDDNFWAVGVKADTDATAQDLGVAPVADTFNVLRVEVNSSGEAKFYVDGVQKGTLMSAAITAATDLTPCIYASVRAAAARTCDIDYVAIAKNRV